MHLRPASSDLAYATYYDSLAKLGEIDWAVMPLQQWGGNDEIKAKRQAEFLVHDSFLWWAVERIGVRNAAAAANVRAALKNATPPVCVEPNWYYWASGR